MSNAAQFSSQLYLVIAFTNADAFDKNRVVYVETKTSADARKIVVAEQPRIVFIEAHSTVFDRRVNV